MFKLFLSLLFLSLPAFALEKTFESSPKPKTFATGLKFKKGWQDSATIASVKIQAALPRHFDWRETGKLNPVFSQKCSDCWSMSTTMVLMDVMALKGMGQNTLSRQYLISCNTEGWSCANGGWFAHDMHKKPYGGILESKYPYEAKDSACKKANLDYKFPLLSWTYIPSANENTPPAVEDIKQAIFQFGPIAAGVSVNRAMQSYSSGVFNQCDNTEPNHAIVLVGWDDDGQYFILKNSWGSGWGQQGYMNIKYGCQKVGIASNYISLDGSGITPPSPIPSPIPSPVPSPSPSPTPAPTPSPSPCSPQPYANAGQDYVVKLGNWVRLGTPAKPATAYHWESSAGKGRTLDTAQILVKPNLTQTFTVFATTKCGTAKSSAVITVKKR